MTDAQNRNARYGKTDPGICRYIPVFYHTGIYPPKYSGPKKYYPGRYERPSGRKPPIMPRSARGQVRSLRHELGQRLHGSQPNETGVCRKREILYSDIFVRLIDDVNRQSPESGALLKTLRSERRMTLGSRLELHQNGAELGIRESVLADSAVSALSERCECLISEITSLKLKLSSLNYNLRLIENAAAQARAVEDRVKAKEIESLQWSRQHLSNKPGGKSSECVQQ